MHAEAQGHLHSVTGQTLLATLPTAALGDLCYIDRRDSNPLPAQVTAFRGETIVLTPLEEPGSLSPRATVRTAGQAVKLRLPRSPFGLVLDCLGQPYAGQRYTESYVTLKCSTQTPSPLERTPIDKQLHTGIRSLDTLCPLGYGQRLGLFAGPGVGKSTLLGMIAQQAEVDLVVVALIGERGREVQEFMEEALGTEGLSRSIVVASTSDESAIRRKLALETATTIAETYRNQGLNVLLLVDSLTRAARAIRDTSLAAGELPIRQGYTSSVYSELPKLIERTGTNSKGSITAIYTLLSESMKELDPLSHEVKSLLDGHICLSPELALRGIRPAIDPLESISRLSGKLLSEEELKENTQILSLLAQAREEREMALLGGNADEDTAKLLRKEEALWKVFTQGVDEVGSVEEARRGFQSVFVEQD